MGVLLESIQSPADLKRMTFAQMGQLAEEIRASVEGKFGIRLEMEPVLVGF